jgi:alkylmercury lyase
MHHKFEVGGRTLWTWCAWDALFIPAILGADALVESADPVSGVPVRLTVTRDRVASVEPRSAVISFLLPDAEEFNKSAANVMAKFCHYGFFFTSMETGEYWTAKHPGTFLYAIDDAVEFARRLNARELWARTLGTIRFGRRGVEALSRGAGAMFKSIVDATERIVGVHLLGPPW